MKLLSLFTGIGAFEKALKNIGINYELIGFSEIDKYAIKSYCAIHNENEEKNLGDITKIDITKLPKDIDIITHGSPCQDFSLAGKQAGGDLGTGTRSSLMWNTISIVTYCKPKYVIWENVKNLLSKKHKHNFDSYLSIMESLGYNNYYKVLNAKDYGIPQNRERVYTISIRKDIDNNNFTFPEKEELQLKLKDILENEVDEKYYLKDYQIENIKKSNFMTNKRRIQEKEYCDTLCARDWKDPKCVRIGGIFDTEKSKHQAGSIYDKNGLAPTLDTMEGGWRQPCIEEGYVEKKYNNFIQENGYIPDMFNPYNEVEINNIAPTQTSQCGSTTSSATILIKNATKKGYEEAIDGDSVNLSYPNSNTRRGRVGHQVSQTLQCNDSMGVLEKNLKIRKLTPKECWRLMGFSDEDFEKAANVPTSNSQLYKQARKFNLCPSP